VVVVAVRGVISALSTDFNLLADETSTCSRKNRNGDATVGPTKPSVKMGKKRSWSATDRDRFRINGRLLWITEGSKGG
jgi:hypothetical protein